MNVNYSTNMLPLVTVGICVRNCASTIRKAIESIMTQDYPHKLIEVIFVDDGSTDKTLSIIKEYESKTDMMMKLFHHEWRGLGFSRNIVVKNALGKYILWVDGDMTLPSNYIQTQVKFMEENPKVAIGKGRYGISDTNNLAAFLENVTAALEFFGDKGVIDNYKPLGTGGSIYRVKAIREVGGFDENIQGAGEDVNLEFRVKNAGWMLGITPAIFYEIGRQNWRDLWSEYFWHGLGAKFIVRYIKQSRSVIFKIFPPYAFWVLFRRSILAYKLVHERRVFLLPLHWIFKRIAWILGFICNKT